MKIQNKTKEGFYKKLWSDFGQEFRRQVKVLFVDENYETVKATLLNQFSDKLNEHKE